MVKARMCSALDGKNIGPAFHERTTFRHDGQWYVCEAGPNYINTWLIEEWDESGLAWLQAHERMEEPE